MKIRTMQFPTYLVAAVAIIGISSAGFARAQSMMDDEVIVVTENGEPVMVTEDGEPVMVTEEGEPVMITEEGGPVMITEEGGPVVITENGQPVGSDTPGEGRRIAPPRVSEMAAANGERMVIADTGEQVILPADYDGPRPDLFANRSAQWHFRNHEEAPFWYHTFVSSDHEFVQYYSPSVPANLGFYFFYDTANILIHNRRPHRNIVFRNSRPHRNIVFRNSRPHRNIVFNRGHRGTRQVHRRGGRRGARRCQPNCGNP